MRRRLLRWGSWFAVVNAAILAILGVRYLTHYAAPLLSTAWLYALVASVGHWAALAYLPFILLLVPMTMLVPRPRVVLPLGVMLAAAGVTLVLLDSLFFGEHRHHLTPWSLMLLSPATWAFAALYLLLATTIEAMLAVSIWRRSAGPPRRRVGRWLAVALAGCFVASHVVHAWADARYHVPVTSFSHYLPLYYPLTRPRVFVRLGLVDRERARERELAARLGRPSDAVLNYPIAPLRCGPSSERLNVLLVVVDAMRADALTTEIAPNLTAFAERAIRFDRHYSGGNSSRAGMFSLFYGLPATYWTAFAATGRPPVLMDVLQQHGYELGLFISTRLDRAVGLERTVLAGVANLRLRSGTTARTVHEKDRLITEEAQSWLERRNPSQPFFHFLYYDAASSRDAPDDYLARFPTPPDATTQQRRYARYLAAVQYVDALAARVLADLERRGLLDRTVVIVTSDHGMEFDENGQGFSGHGTSYSRYQMHTPMVLHWPGRSPDRVGRRTSHNDLAPTLVSRLFGCTNPASDYSSGHDLFSDTEWGWLVAASYDDFALIEPDRVTVTYPSGYYEVRDAEYRLVSQPVRRDLLAAALSEMRRFYR